MAEDQHAEARVPHTRPPAPGRSPGGAARGFRRAPIRARRQRTRSGVAVGLCIAVLGALLVSAAAAAFAAEVTRTEYREAAEPICKVDTQANERILAGVKAEVRAGRLGPPAAKFARAAKALHKALGQLEALPRPPADQARLARWFQTVGTEAGYFEAVSRKLAAGQKAAAERYVNKLTSTASKADNQVLPFEFEYCRLEPSRFT